MYSNITGAELIAGRADESAGSPAVEFRKAFLAWPQHESRL